MRCIVCILLVVISMGAGGRVRYWCASYSTSKPQPPKRVQKLTQSYYNGGLMNTDKSDSDMNNTARARGFPEREGGSESKSFRIGWGTKREERREARNIPREPNPTAKWLSHPDSLNTIPLCSRGKQGVGPGDRGVCGGGICRYVF